MPGKALCAAFLGGFVIALTACGGQRDRKEGYFEKEGPGVFGRSAETPTGEASPPGPRSREAWTIMIEAFPGESGRGRAEQTLGRVRAEGGLPGAFVEDRDDAIILAYGQYPGPDDRRARADLARIQQMDFDGAKPYASAKLVPPLVRGTRPELDLRNVKESFGPGALYTLQVGVYSREDTGRPSPDEIAEFRRFAEEAAAKLRAEGEAAFYYHGPLRSMVTIGVFGHDDFDAQTGFESPAVSQLREKYPYNLQNGRGVRERVTMTNPQGQQTRVERMQKSTLVAIP